MSNIAEKKVRELGYGKDPLYRNEYSANDVFEAAVECYDQAMQDFDEQYKIAYVVTRSDLHYDEVEKVFFDEKKAEEYCKSFNEDKNSYHRNITKIEVSL